MINVVCLKWGTKYGPEYVNKLYAAIKRNTTVPFNFYCFTEDASGIRSDITIKPLIYKELETWWNKLYLFSNETGFEPGSKIVFFDLDTLVTGNIDQLLRHDPTSITVLRDFYTGIAKSIVGNDNVGSGLMSWHHEQYTEVWTSFIKDPQAAMKLIAPHGDQRWIQHVISKRLYWQDILTDQVVSFKVHCNQSLPSTARVVCYHGKPSIPDSITQTTTVFKWVIQPAPWVLDHWRE